MPACRDPRKLPVSSVAEAGAGQACHHRGVSDRYPLDNALFNWEAGSRHLAALESRGRAGDALEVVESVRDGIRRRIGSTFTAADLADLYGRGTDWVRSLPGVDPSSADLQEVVDAAFWQHLQGASDFAGGRVVTESEEGDRVRRGGS